MQHREWNPKAFFRKVSPAVMALFEARFEMALVRHPGKPTADQTYHAWKALPDAERRAAENRLLLVNDMCSTHARPYLADLAQRCWSHASPHLLRESRNWSVHDLAMRLFVEAPDVFQNTHRNYAVDTMDHFREYRGRYPVTVQASAATKEKMRNAMMEHFREHAGGAKCQVEDFQGDGKFAMFIYHEDDVTPEDTFDDDGFVVPKWVRPVVRIAAVYYAETCTLLVKAPRQQERHKLLDLFAEIVIGDRHFFDDPTKIPRFSFAPLIDPWFAFATHPADGIVSVCVTRMIVRPIQAGVRSIDLGFEPNLPLPGVHSALLKHGVRLDGGRIEGLQLRFEFAEGKGRARFRTVSLSNPNSSNLKDVHRDRLIRRCLKEWQIDASGSALALAVSLVHTAAGR